VEVDAPDHVAAARIEHRVRGPLPGAEVVGVALQSARFSSRGMCLGQELSGYPGVAAMCSIDDAGVVVLLVVLRPERLEDEVGSLGTERDVKVGRTNSATRPIVEGRLEGSSESDPHRASVFSPERASARPT
jgi:hypothetical protein